MQQPGRRGGIYPWSECRFHTELDGQVAQFWVMRPRLRKGLAHRARRLRRGQAHGRAATNRPTGRLILIPAHDEERDVAQAVRSALAQTVEADRVIVVADNCSDRTAAVAAEAGAEIIVTVGNRAKKAGALNQAWRSLRPSLSARDVVLVMDADTELAPEFLRNAERHLRHDRSLGGCCASFYGKAGSGGSRLRGLLGLLQRMEYVRYQQSIARRNAITPVLSGTATAFRVGTLDRLVRERGFVWHEESMLEDYELSLAFRHRGLRCLAPGDCRSYTDVMPTMLQLWHQRVRWQRGTIEELRRYGISRVTARDVGRQLLLAGAVLARVMFVLAVAGTLVVTGGMSVNWLFAGLGGIVAFERAWTIRELGPGACAVALALVVEESYGIFREAFWCRSLWLSLRRRDWVSHTT